LSKLNWLQLDGNSLCGEIPVGFKNLSLIPYPGDSHLRLNNNHLSASDAELIAWLDSRNPDWDTTQTSCSGFFTTPIVKVAENSGGATVTVQRNDDILDYATTEGSARQGDDYIGATGTLNGDVITISINDDSHSEANETFTITLIDPISGESLDNATIVIEDNEPANCAAVTEIPTTECEALVALYNNTGGANWYNNAGWKVTNMPCSWDGVSCRGGHVSSLFLSNNGLTGSIPARELTNLTHLMYLDLSQNPFTGSIPTELGNLTSLTYIDLSNNSLTGSIPTELGNLSNLEHLSLYGNQLTGSIPRELGNLTNLSDLNLYYNQLTGSIPSELGNLSNLERLELYSNQLTGSIPSQLGNLTKLDFFSLAENQLSGSIPSELGNMSNLRYLSLYSNELSGSIPTELGNLTKLEFISLDDNQLSGSIPTELSNLSNLGSLNLSSNQLTGSIPTELGNLSNLGGLNLSSNQLSGSIPTELGNLSNLRRLDLSNNQLSGSIPTEFGNLSNLNYLNLSNNQLSGSIPTELGNLSNLDYLWLNNNQLSGLIPTKLSNFLYVEVNNNELCGEIPVEFKYSNIKLDNNHLTTSDSEVIAWLDSSNPGWETKQTPCPIAILQFLPTTYSVTEDGGIVTITVTRAGNGAISANYATNDDTTDSDYIQTTGTLYWADDDLADKTITITIIDDGKFEYHETFTITLSSPVSGEILDIATVTINDNDPFDCADITEIPSTECETLIALYDSTGGANWENNTGWNVTNTPCNWYGVECSDGHVTGLKLAFNRLTGSIPAELGNLSHLIILQLGSSYYAYPISEILQDIIDTCGSYSPCLEAMGWWEFSYLQTVENHLSGSIPPELGNLSHLEFLHLGVGNLSGSIPAELGKMSQLKSLELHYNELCGVIPVELKNLSSILRLKLDNNHLIPPNVGTYDSELLAWLDEHNPGWESTQTPCPPQIDLEKDSYNPGELFQARLTEKLAWGYDLYAAVVMPDGNFFALTKENEFAAMNTVAKWDGQRIADSPVMLLDLILPENLPGGEYCLYGILSPKNQSVLENVDLWVWTVRCLFIN
jgi:Leucine-rich repeat (LRR) protein